jgi:soluble lytic murein transglycosylase
MYKRILVLVLLGIVLMTCSVSIWYVSETKRIARYNLLISEAAERYDVDENLIRAVIWRESGFNERAKGSAQEKGLMQVTPRVGEAWAKSVKLESFQESDLFDARTNIHAGTWYLAQARKRWQDTDMPEMFALAEYNAGRSQALRWAKKLEKPVGNAFWDEIDFPSTKEYVNAVLEQYYRYRANVAPGPFGNLWQRVLKWWEGR